jgi:polynucleotide 5'-hydroxyl-kinase GRC3/NOL9
LNKQVEKGKTLLVDGPASVAVVSGKAEVFGLQISDSRIILIREGKRLPFTVEETANFKLALGNAGAVEEVEDSTIPPSWQAAFETLRGLQKKPAVAMVIGGVDSGKTSFCTYLINRLTREKQAVAVLDEDMGQSDIGPPCTIAYAHVSKPVTDLFSLEGENTFFVGATSPSDAADATVEGTATLMAEILCKKTPDFVVVNTDGWATGEAAVEFKSRLAKAVNPDVVFCLEPKDEVPTLCATFGDALGEFQEERADSPVAVRLRDKEKRRNLRELGYAKYLAGAKVKSFSLKRLKIKECCQNSPQNLTVKAPGIEAPKKKLALRLGELRGLLMGLHDGQNRFLGIGTLQGVDYTRQMLKVRTSVSAEPTCIVLGKVRLDENFHEFSTPCAST